MRRLNMLALIAFVVFVALVFLANWMIANVGSCPPPGTPAACAVPVWPWPLIVAPSGVYAAALVLVVRDWLYEVSGRAWVLAGVLSGAALSGWMSGPLAVASAVAFAVAELADWLVYARVRARGVPLAVLASGLVGVVVDSVLFLWLAFGSLAFVEGQVIGKVLATLAAFIVVSVFQRVRQARLVVE